MFVGGDQNYGYVGAASPLFDITMAMLQIHMT
jgi:hypothetical protein